MNTSGDSGSPETEVISFFRFLLRPLVQTLQTSYSQHCQTKWIWQLEELSSQQLEIFQLLTRTVLFWQITLKCHLQFTFILPLWSFLTTLHTFVTHAVPMMAPTGIQKTRFLAWADLDLFVLLIGRLLRRLLCSTSKTPLCPTIASLSHSLWMSQGLRTADQQEEILEKLLQICISIESSPPLGLLPLSQVTLMALAA